MQPATAEWVAKFDKTHDLIRLTNLMQAPIGLVALRQKLAMLSAAAVEFRYPGEVATREMAKEAIITCKAVRTEARQQLCLNNS